MSSLSLSAISAIESAINLALKQDSPSQTRLAKLAGQQVFLYIEDFSFILQIHILEQGVMLHKPDSLDEIELDPRLDTLVQGPSSAYRKLLEGDGFFDGDLRIQGNAQALMTLHKVMENFEFDWEGLLADYIGDLPASALARLLRMQWTWSKEFTTSARIQLVNHLQTDSQLLPSKIEFDHYVDELERFGTALDRTEAKLRMLEKKLSS
ncbi:ubiquinone biosynthesis accessory factor UbiJ [Marinomonas colpomeniae]|uniref:Ubiquinone biosynthesis accessory factor UbiJ n=1 Tax=Marinomonas colpomeniae TaxID=2774408 RepID=A0ABR8P2M1_9GAMM|nr:SCP2 sterol-binding domain-containing protein [Marinomonas colpomeniae]MBD5772511.1 SCP2 sterol-binding domain-containing protein [Marinomonas colpomeniae]